MNNLKASFFVLATAFLWGSVPAISKLLLKNIDEWQILFLGSLFGFLGLLIALLFQKKLGDLFLFLKTFWLRAVLMGFLGVALYNFLLYVALKILPAQEAFIANYLWPILTVIFASAILKERITILGFFGMCVSFFGVVFTLAKGNLTSLTFKNPLGIAVALAAALTYGLFSALEKRNTEDKIISVTAYYLFGTIFSFIGLLIFSSLPSLSVPSVAGLLWIGVFTNGVAFLLWFLALKYGKTVLVANMIFLTPFLSLFYIALLTEEKILTSSVIGLIFVVAGIILNSLKKA